MLVSKLEGYSRTQIKKWILEGRVLVNGEISNPKDLVNENDEIEINPIEENKILWKGQKWFHIKKSHMPNQRRYT